MDKLMLGGQGYSLVDIEESNKEDIINASDFDFERYSERGPCEIEEEQRADEIEVISGVRLRQDRGQHDDYEEELDEYNDAVDARYFEEEESD